MSITGTINNFMTGDTSRPSWKVTLTVDGADQTEGVQPRPNLDPITNEIPNGQRVVLWTAGTWNGNFYAQKKKPIILRP